MDDQEQNGSNDQEQNGSKNNSGKKKGRKATSLKVLIRSRAANQKLPIEFNDRQQARGPNKSLFVSFVALQGRMRASILVSEWESIEEGVKNQIWEAIQLTFDVPNTQILRSRWVAYAGSRWAGFKTYLTSNFIYGTRCGEDPTEKYKWIDAETWKQFVLSRKDPKFLERRKKAQETQAYNDCPHRLSRGGYDLLEEKLMAEKLKMREEASQSDPSLLLNPPSPIRFFITLVFAQIVYSKAHYTSVWIF
ncbi:unnamed protein product [Cuscuta epithymum]|uniref:Uncharacterized protein n=1 Tax=Cuscuta epithymum TaxID=186058 RepID=A0AAV0ERY0_9ASTE|nr:unnamed protein product [Cuscuta epithymum]